MKNFVSRRHRLIKRRFFVMSHPLRYGQAIVSDSNSTKCDTPQVCQYGPGPEKPSRDQKAFRPIQATPSHFPVVPPLQRGRMKLPPCCVSAGDERATQAFAARVPQPICSLSVRMCPVTAPAVGCNRGPGCCGLPLQKPTSPYEA